MGGWWRVGSLEKPFAILLYHFAFENCTKIRHTTVYICIYIFFIYAWQINVENNMMAAVPWG